MFQEAGHHDQLDIRFPAWAEHCIAIIIRVGIARLSNDKCPDSRVACDFDTDRLAVAADNQPNINWQIFKVSMTNQVCEGPPAAAEEHRNWQFVRVVHVALTFRT